MNQGKINYMLQGYKTQEELRYEAEQIAKKESPDISKMRGIRIDKRTIIYPKTDEQYEKLLSRGNHK